MYSNSPELNLKRYFVDSSTEDDLIIDHRFNDLCIDKTIWAKFRLHRPTQAINMNIFPASTSHKFFPSIKQISWSPHTKSDHDYLLLTILTYGASLNIYSVNAPSWDPSLAISKLWLSELKKEWEKTTISMKSSSEELLSVIRDRTYRAKITAYEWGRTYADSVGQVWVSFFTANFKGEVAFWKIKTSTNKLEAVLDQVLLTDLIELNALYYGDLDSTSCILAASCDGRLQLILLKRLNEDSFCLEKKAIIWPETDNIHFPPEGYVCCKWVNGVVFITCKEIYIVGFYVDFDGKLKSICTSNIADVPIAGISKCSETDILAVTRSGNLYRLNIGDMITLKIDFSLICTSVRPSDTYICQGMAVSASKTIIMLCYTFCEDSDYQEVRSPTQIVIVTIPQLRNAFQIISELQGPFTDYWDALEVLRLQQVMTPNSEITSLMTSEPTVDLCRLRKNVWISRILWVTDKALNPRKKATAKRHLENLYIVLMNNRVKDILLNEELTTFQMNFVRAAKNWMTYVKKVLFNSLDEKMKKMVQYFDDEVAESLQDSFEKCVLCAARVLTPEGTTEAKCEGGHRVPRCCLSLVQVIEYDHYICNTCGLVAHSDAVCEFGSHCSICESQMFKSRWILRE